MARDTDGNGAGEGRAGTGPAPSRGGGGAAGTDPAAAPDGTAHFRLPLRVARVRSSS